MTVTDTPLTRLDTIPLRRVKGVSAPKEQELHAFGIYHVEDLLNYFPFRYEDYRLRSLVEVKNGEKITVQGTIRGLPMVSRFGKGKMRITCKTEVEGQLITAVWFNRMFIKDQLQLGAGYYADGQVGRAASSTDGDGFRIPGSGHGQNRHLAARVLHRRQYYADVDAQDDPSGAPPVRTAAGGESAAAAAGQVPAHAPGEAVLHIHHPDNPQDGQGARRRLVYEELFFFQLKLQAYRMLNRRRADGIVHRVDPELIRAFAASLPFELTDAQKKVVNELLSDMRQPYAMNRLLQGDVGAGKTVVAAIALLAAVKAGHQGALMVPTEILAEQHMRSLTRLYEGTGVQTALLTGSVSERKRRDLLAGLQMGLIDVLIGTHALIQDDVIFRSLGLVVTDEQHRFGVNQRSVLRRKGPSPMC